MVNRSLLRERPQELSPLTRAVYDLLREADLGFVNLEVPLTNRGYPADKLVTFRADPAVAQDLVDIGVDVVTFANNHALDFGTEGFLQTLDTLDAAGLPRVGAGRDLAESLRPAILSAAGQRVAFVGMATTVPAGAAAREGRPGIASIRVFTHFVVDTEALEEQPGTAPYVQTEALQADVERACSAVRRAAQEADHVIVGIHWGVPHGWVAPFQDPLATYQRPLAHALIDAGATAVIGNHAHVLHGIEIYRNRPVLYCLGNFVFHRLAPGTPLNLSRNFPPYSWKTLRSRINRLSCVSRIRLTPTGVDRVEMVPVVINDLGEPERADAEQAEEILAMLADLSEPLGTRVRRKGGLGIVEPHGGWHAEARSGVGA